MEIWKDIKGYEGIYIVSTLGRVKRLAKDISELKSKRNNSWCYGERKTKGSKIKETKDRERENWES